MEKGDQVAIGDEYNLGSHKWGWDLEDVTTNEYGGRGGWR